MILSHWLCKKPDRGIIQIVGEGNSVPLDNFEDFMLAIAIKGGPMPVYVGESALLFVRVCIEF